MSILLVVSFRFPYLHAWPKCHIPSKGYLKNLHRHVLHGRAWFPVRSADRELEFIEIKEAIEAWCLDHFSCTHADPSLSCEAIASRILEEFSPCQRVEILEDGENGALVSKEPA